MSDEFLDSLKVGDEVGINGHYSITLHKITKITKTRRFEIDNGNKYSNIGRLIGDHYNRSWICPKEAYYKKQEQNAQDKIKSDLVEIIKSQRFGNFSIEKLQKILKIINEE